MNYKYISYTISINFAIITQLSLKWLNFQEHSRFHSLMVFTRLNELMKLVRCLCWKTLIFHYGMLLQLPAETHPLTQDRKSPCQNLTGSHISRKSHYDFAFFLTRNYSSLLCCQWRGTGFVLPKAGWREKIVKMKHKASTSAQGKVLFCTNVPVDYFASDLSFHGSEDQWILLLFLLYLTDGGLFLQ